MRQRSLFLDDIEENLDEITARIQGKTILVIGGAGTIGTAFIKALLPLKPERLIVVDYSENGLTELTRDLRSQDIFIPGTYITYPFDFGSEVFAKMFQRYHFDIIACFAAHKHVRSEKDHLAIEAMVQNNVFNTKKLIDLALLNKPDRFFSVSTDKAANPVNVMGVSKKIMEELLMAYSDDLNITTARFANVAFSNGSLLAGFIDRIMKKQPLSAPKDIKRYFVSPEESGQLCLLACVLGNSGEIFFPKLKENQMLTFSHIAKIFLNSIGLQAQLCSSETEAKELALNWTPTNESYPVYFFKSETSGEKKFEEFYDQADKLDIHKYKALGVISNVGKPNIYNAEKILVNLKEIFQSEALDKAKIIEMLTKVVSNFKHIETGNSLDQKM